MQKKKLTEQAIVITGAAGFIGSGVIRHLNDQGYTNLFLVDDIGTTEKWKNLLGKRFREIIPIQGLFNGCKANRANRSLYPSGSLF